MIKWEDSIERQLRAILGDGDVSDLPGAGKPLDLREDQHTPVDLRAARKIMRDHAVLPDWMDSGRELERLVEDLQRQISIRAERYQRNMVSAENAGLINARDEIESAWKRYLNEFDKRVEHYNREALRYNLKVPQGIAHKRILNSDKLIRRAMRS